MSRSSESKATENTLFEGSNNGNATLELNGVNKVNASDSLKFPPCKRNVRMPVMPMLGSVGATCEFEKLKWNVSAAVDMVVICPAWQSPSIAAPSWQAKSDDPFSVELSADMIWSVKRADWL